MPATATRPRSKRRRDLRAALRIQSFSVEYRCLNEVCDSAIRPEHVWRKINREGNAAVITAYCPHCQGMYRAEELIENGLWRIVGGIERIEDPAERAAILARVDEQSHVIQLREPAA